MNYLPQELEGQVKLLWQQKMIKDLSYTCWEQKKTFDKKNCDNKRSIIIQVICIFHLLTKFSIHFKLIRIID